MAVKTIFAAALTTTCLAATAYCKLGSPGGPLKLPREAPDSFKIMMKFEYAVAISDSDNDTIFECLSANRTDIDLDSRTATYNFLLPLTGQELLYHLKPGDEPGTVIFTSDSDPTPREAINYYTDGENCVVADLELQGEGHQCTLWARRSVKDNVPQDCIDYFVDICGVIVPPHSRDLCPDGEGDY